MSDGDVSGQLDVWYCVFSPQLRTEWADVRWVEASTDEDARHCYLVRGVGGGVIQIEETRFAAFAEYVPFSLPRVLLHAKRLGSTVIEWGVLWDDERMGGAIKSETLTVGHQEPSVRDLPNIPRPVYIQPGYFSCVALCKLFLNIMAPAVQTPAELRDYMLNQGAERI